MNTTHIKLVLLLLAGYFIANIALSQSDTIKISAKNKEKIVVLSPGEDATVIFEDENSRLSVGVESNSNVKANKAETEDTAGNLAKDVYLKLKERKDEKKNYSLNILSDFAIGYAINQTDLNLGVIPKPLISNNGVNFSMNLIKQDINLVKHRLSLVTALGINNYYFSMTDKNLSPVKNSVTNQYDYFRDTLNSYKVNRMDSRFLNIPILLKWDGNGAEKHGKFAVAAGVEFNFNNRTFAKQKIDTEEMQLKSKTNLGYDIDNFMPSFIAKIQYGSLSVFARMTQDKIFSRLSNSLRVFSFGIASKF